MRPSLARIGRIFLGLTAVVVALALLQVWELIALSPTTALRILLTYGLLSVLLLVHAVITQLRDDGPRSGDGDRLID